MKQEHFPPHTNKLLGERIIHTEEMDVELIHYTHKKAGRIIEEYKIEVPTVVKPWVEKCLDVRHKITTLWEQIDKYDERMTILDEDCKEVLYDLGRFSVGVFLLYPVYFSFDSPRIRWESFLDKEQYDLDWAGESKDNIADGTMNWVVCLPSLETIQWLNTLNAELTKFKPHESNTITK